MDKKTTPAPTIEQGKSFDQFIKLLFPPYITSDANTLRVWVYLLQHATKIEFTLKHPDFPRGQFTTTAMCIAYELNISADTVLDSLKKLEPYISTDVEIKDGVELLFFTIPHYDFYLNFFVSNED